MDGNAAEGAVLPVCCIDLIQFGFHMAPAFFPERDCLGIAAIRDIQRLHPNHHRIRLADLVCVS
ncbi:hypothetical protein D3C76_1510430 [compost metagenome]